MTIYFKLLFCPSLVYHLTCGNNICYFYITIVILCVWVNKWTHRNEILNWINLLKITNLSLGKFSYTFLLNISLLKSIPIGFKSNSIKDLNITAKTIVLLEENLHINLCDFGFGKGFLDMIPKAWATKQKIYTLKFIKIKNFCWLCSS